jgi:hypothetical protein
MQIALSKAGCRSAAGGADELIGLRRERYLRPGNPELWPESEVPRRPRFGRDQVENGHEGDIARRPSLTRSGHEPN